MTMAFDCPADVARWLRRNALSFSRTGVGISTVDVADIVCGRAGEGDEKVKVEPSRLLPQFLARVLWRRGPAAGRVQSAMLACARATSVGGELPFAGSQAR